MKIVNYGKNKEGQAHTYFGDTVIRGEIRVDRKVFIEWVNKQLKDKRIPQHITGAGKFAYFSRETLAEDTKAVRENVEQRVCNIRVSFTGKLVKDLKIKGDLKSVNYIIVFTSSYKQDLADEEDKKYLKSEEYKIRSKINNWLYNTVHEEATADKIIEMIDRLVKISK